MIPLEEAQARIRSDIGVLPVVEVPPAESLGLVVQEPVLAVENIPPFANSAMDGFAVRAVDTDGATSATPVTLPVVATVAAGTVAPRALAPGEAMRIMTGAPLPEGADSIVMVELTEMVEGTEMIVPDGESTVEKVAILAQVPPGHFVRPAGDDVQAGAMVIAPGTMITPAHIGVLAGVGRERVAVRRRARVGVFSTGDELVVGSAPLQPGQIRDSNRPALLALVREAGAEPVDLGCLRDDRGAIERALRGAVDEVDVLLTSGGVSMGDFDFVKEVLGELGELNWMQVAIKPAKPLAFGVLAGTPIFGLPGNPVSSVVSFELFARPAIRAMMGVAQPERRKVWAIADEPLWRTPDGKVHFQRVILSPQSDGAWRVRSAGGQGSHQMSALAAANGLAVVPDGDGINAGQRVQVIPLT